VNPKLARQNNGTFEVAREIIELALGKTHV
jgi:hypothetical protein